MSDDVLARAERWVRHDPDPNTRAQLEKILAQARSADPSAAAQEAALADLRERFSGPLEFGTAGLRGLIGPGETRMNRAVVIRTTAGLAAYLLDTVGDAARTKGVAIGYDGRIMSREFAEDTAAVLAAAGLPSFLSPIPCPTPVTAYAVERLGAVAGVMVTASHNPPDYNGYKAYWGNGAQIIPPHDKGIAAAIARQPEADGVPRSDFADARAKGNVKDFPPDLEESYLAAIQRLSIQKGGDRSFPIVYTPLHGVGNRLVRRALADAGFTRVTSVPEQAEPDGRFPTVAFPNPEEKGALDLAYALAEREGADLVIANDPDVDRLAVAVRKPGGPGWVQLTGNQVGVLLGHYVLTEGAQEPNRLVIASCVSSPMLGAVAKLLGVRYEETLTGFKWIANRAMDLARESGAKFVFGYEEALGYTVGPLVRDKDGIGAALLLAELAAVRRAQKKTLLDELEAIARKVGLYVSGQRSLTMPGADGLARIGGIMAKLRDAAPRKVSDFEVMAVADYQAGTRVEHDGATSKLTLPSTNMLVLELNGGSRIIARPSGTEPKIKFYFDLVEPLPPERRLAEAQTSAAKKLDALADAFVAAATG